MHASGKKLDHLSSSAHCRHRICKCDKVFHPFTGLGMRICCSPRGCWLVHCLLEGISKTRLNLKHALPPSEGLQTLHPLPAATCFRTTAVPVLCSQLPLPEMFLAMVCTELPWSRLLVAVSLVAMSFLKKMSLSLPLFHWDQLLYPQAPKVTNRP